MDYRAMTTPMALNMKLLSDASLDMVDAMMYRQMIHSLMYLMTTRPDICFAMNTLRHVHLMVAKHVVRYLKGTVEYGIKCDLLVWRDGVLHGAECSGGKRCSTCYLGGSMFLLKTII